ncbi:ferritin-like domain-containing protein [Mrakia frigida]|uniref:ferritin-like domain-containing protein n=1 Tax=Mrakia frigida TaxID=29902 RepID=UPI003FCC1F9A
MIGPLALAASLLPLISSVVAAPLWSREQLERRQAASAIVLQFAYTLEQLESQFYIQALAKFTPEQYTSAGFVSSALVAEQLGVVSKDEAAHVTALEAAIVNVGQFPIAKTCTFDFTAALTDVPTFIATARVLEYVGTSAYLGASTIIDDKAILISAAQILTIEARHSSLLNSLTLGQYAPAAFDQALLPPAILSLAGGFITGGCDLSPLGVTATATLTVTADTGAVQSGSKLSFSSSGPSVTGQLFCHMFTGGAVTSVVFPLDSCVVPDGLLGPVYIYVTSNGQPINGNVINADAATIVAGPALAFIDPATPELLGQSLRIGGVAADSSTPVAATEPAVVATATAAAEGTVVAATATPSASVSSGTAAASNDGGAKVISMPAV